MKTILIIFRPDELKSQNKNLFRAIISFHKSSHKGLLARALVAEGGDQSLVGLSPSEVIALAELIFCKAISEEIAHDHDDRGAEFQQAIPATNQKVKKYLMFFGELTLIDPPVLRPLNEWEKEKRKFAHFFSLRGEKLPFLPSGKEYWGFAAIAV